MMEKIVTWVMRLLRREVLEIGQHGLDRYLTRWTLLGKRFGTDRGKVFLHLFHRGDADPYFHDHPWAFWSLILWGGYWEETPTGKKWYGMGRLLRRPAEWKHRVELPPGRKCWTLIWCGPKSRSWGFWSPECGFVPWRQHMERQEAGLPVCDE